MSRVVFEASEVHMSGDGKSNKLRGLILILDTNSPVGEVGTGNQSWILPTDALENNLNDVTRCYFLKTYLTTEHFRIFDDVPSYHMISWWYEGHFAM